MQDVNGTGFKLVLGRSDWRDQFGVESGAACGPAVVYDDAGRSATLRSRVDRFPRRSAESTLGPVDRTSAARDRYGSWYWIDPDDRTRIVVRNAGDDAVETFWSSDEPETGNGPQAAPDGSFRPVRDESAPSPSLGVLTVTTDHRLVVTTTTPDQLLAFDLHAGGPPQRIPWIREAPFAPIDATPRPDGGLYLLDTPADRPARVWAFGRGLRPDGRTTAPTPSAFRPADEEVPEARASRPSPPEPALVFRTDAEAQVVEALPDDSVLVLFPTLEDDSHVRRYQPFAPDAARAAGPDDLNLNDELKPKTDCDDEDAEASDEDSEASDEGAEASGENAETWEKTWRAYDMAFVPGSPGPTESVRGTLFVVGTDGNQAFALHLTDTGEGTDYTLKPEYLPLRRFSGKGLVEADGEVYYDMGDRWFTLTPQRRPRFEARGRATSAPFDSERAGCTWHRVFLDACIPPEAEVRLECRASDRRDRLSDQPWREQPALYQRDTGAELPYYDPFPDGDEEGRGTWEVLLQNAKGRYLQLRLTLEGNGRTAPRISALRVYFPRFSYLEEYMPDVYQDDEASAGFVERFLANSEGTLTEIEGRIAAAETLFDVRTVPDGYLDWLATWFGASFDPALDARRKRLFLDHAMELFRQRGTMAGLARMLRLVLDPCVDESLFTPAGVAGAVGRPEDAGERTARRGGVRLVEAFAARDVPRAALGDARVPEQPIEVRVANPWTPPDGAETLHRRFRSFLDEERYEGPAARSKVWSATAFPPLLPPESDPQGRAKRADWRIFVRRVIDGPYAAIDHEALRDDAPTLDGSDADGQRRPDETTLRFRAFLQRRYRTFDDRVPARWRQDAGAFGEVALPRELPTGQALTDWMHFVGAVLPIHRSAHRFRVLVPVDPDADPDRQEQRLALARRVVEKEKPAHTAFEVLPYWAAFRVGVARTGLDTVLGTGSRYAPLLVGQGALAQETVGAAHPQSVPDRRLVGRDAAGDDRPL